MRLTMNAFLPASPANLLEEVEADQQVRAETHAFPAHEQHQIVRAEHQNQHEEHEQIQVREEPVIAALVRHVAGGVDVDEHADAGNDQQHDGGEAVDRKSKPMFRAPL